MGLTANTSIAQLPAWSQLLLSAAIGAAIATIGAIVCWALIRRNRKAGPDSDSVTGAANRRAFVHQLDAAWRSAGEGGDEFGVLVIDVDAFGDINHLYGRATGDRVLAEVAERIRLRVRTGDFVARVDADEFGVICHAADEYELETLRRNLEAYVNFAQSVPVTLSIGMAVPEDGDLRGIDLLERARQSLSESRDERPLRVVDDALAELLRG